MFLEEVALVPSPALRSQALAFALGYVSHIAADIALNPWIDAMAPRLLPRRGSAHFLLELCLDEYLATTYFEHPRYSLFYQPWGEYIEPAARSLSQPASVTTQMLRLLVGAVEIYRLGEERSETLPRDFLRGLQGLRHFLAGRGKARWLIPLTGQLRERQELVSKLLAGQQSDEESIPLEKVLGYATHLSEHLCRRAVSYYTALRNPNAEASERSSRRAILRSDLRNWDLYTGYASNEKAQEPEPASLDNRVYFSDLWEQEDQAQEHLAGHIQTTS